MDELSGVGASFDAVAKYEMHCFEREVAAVRELLRSM